MTCERCTKLEEENEKLEIEKESLLELLEITVGELDKLVRNIEVFTKSVTK